MARRVFGRLALPLWLGLLVACGDEQVIEPPPPPPGPTYHGAEIVRHPVNGLAAETFITAARYDSVSLRYWTEGAAGESTPVVRLSDDTVFVVPIVGLLSLEAYDVEITLYAEDTAAPVDTVPYATLPLPSWIPPAAAQGGDTVPGFLAISYPEGPVIIDNQGRVRWYVPAPDDLLLSFQAHDNGRYTLFRLNDSTALFHVLDPLGNDERTLGCVGRPTRFHDLLWEASGDYWVLCDDSTVMDLSVLNGRDSANTIWTVLQHVSADGSLLFEWDSRDHFDITDLAESERLGTRVNVTHGNGIMRDTDGNVLLSFRSLNEVTKIDAETGEVMWRFGGLRNEFTFVNDAKASFERPHGLRQAGPAIIQLLDNGLQAPSRLVRYLINPVSKTATLVWEFLDSPTTFTPVGGATEYYPNGYGVVTFGRAGRVVEVDPAGNRTWELVGIDNVYVFRVQRIRSLYTIARALEF